MFILQLNYGSVILYICSIYIEFISFCYFCIPAVNEGLNKLKNVIWGNVRSRKCHLGNCPFEKCLRGTVHRRKVHRANIRRGNVRWGNVHPGTVLEIILIINPCNYRLIINLFHSLYDLKKFILNKAATKDLNCLLF